MTHQLDQWRGSFGDAYIDRCQADDARLRVSTKLWATILSRMAGDPPRSILEVGSNVGANLAAISRLTDADLSAVEPNAKARAVLASTMPRVRAAEGIAQNVPFADDSFDLVFTSGVLIHIAPDDLLAACSEVHRCSRKYIVCCEYFADEPEEKAYRGHTGLLFKRDFGGFYLDHFPDLEPIDCGFAWRRLTGCDNPTWWVLRKRLHAERG